MPLVTSKLALFYKYYVRVRVIGMYWAVTVVSSSGNETLNNKAHIYRSETIYNHCRVMSVSNAKAFNCIASIFVYKGELATLSIGS